MDIVSKRSTKSLKSLLFSMDVTVSENDCLYSVIVFWMAFPIIVFMVFLKALIISVTSEEIRLYFSSEKLLVKFKLSNKPLRSS